MVDKLTKECIRTVSLTVNIAAMAERVREQSPTSIPYPRQQLHI